MLEKEAKLAALDDLADVSANFVHKNIRNSSVSFGIKIT